MYTYCKPSLGQRRQGGIANGQNVILPLFKIDGKAQELEQGTWFCSPPLTFYQWCQVHTNLWIFGATSLPLFIDCCNGSITIRHHPKIRSCFNLGVVVSVEITVIVVVCRE